VFQPVSVTSPQRNNVLLLSFPCWTQTPLRTSALLTKVEIIVQAVSLMLPILIIVISIASGLAFLNLILLITLCLLRQRRKETKLAEEDGLGSLEDRLSPIKQRQPPKSKKAHSRSLQGSVQWPSTPPNLHIPRDNPRRSEYIDFADFSLLKPPSSLARSGGGGGQIPSVPRVSVSRQSTTAGRTEETASVYSAESAPLHLHHQISNPLLTNRVAAENITRSSLPRGMDLPSTITRDLGLFLNSNRVGYAPFLIDNVTSTTKALNITKKRASIDTAYDSPSDSKMRSALPHTTPIPHSPRFRTALAPERNHALLHHRRVTPRAA